MLRKKQSIESNEEWLQALEQSTSLYTRFDIDELEAATISKMETVVASYRNICHGWIAGKDSLVLSKVLAKSGVKTTPIMWRGINEYPAMKDWVDNNKPSNLIEEIIDKYSLEFLEAHPEYLFCKGNTRQKWMATKWERQRKDIRKHNFDLFITGRRLKDGNQCGTANNNYIAHKNGYDVYSPLAEWNNEQLLAYIRYNNIVLPPFYGYERGFLIGSIAMGEWTERATLGKTENEVWEELYRIDKNIVLRAAQRLTSARQYLISKENNYED